MLSIVSAGMKSARYRIIVHKEIKSKPKADKNEPSKLVMIQSRRSIPCALGLEEGFGGIFRKSGVTDRIANMVNGAINNNPTPAISFGYKKGNCGVTDGGWKR
jgi:hypothetical protein